MSAANGPRHRWIDGLFNRTDPWPEVILSGGLGLVVLLVALWLFGVILPNPGRPGPLVFEESPPPALAWLRTGDEPEVTPDEGWSDHRDWLDANLCAVSADWDGRAERQALARRLSDDARLCEGLERSLARAPLAPMAGTAASTLLALILTGLLGWVAIRISLSFFHVRRAYRRLYLSEHRTDHEEEAASLASEGPPA